MPISRSNSSPRPTAPARQSPNQVSSPYVRVEFDLAHPSDPRIVHVHRCRPRHRPISRTLRGSARSCARLFTRCVTEMTNALTLAQKMAALSELQGRQARPSPLPVRRAMPRFADPPRSPSVAERSLFHTFSVASRLCKLFCDRSQSLSSCSTRVRSLLRRQQREGLSAHAHAPARRDGTAVHHRQTLVVVGFRALSVGAEQSACPPRRQRAQSEQDRSRRCARPPTCARSERSGQPQAHQCAPRQAMDATDWLRAPSRPLRRHSSSASHGLRTRSTPPVRGAGARVRLTPSAVSVGPAVLSTLADVPSEGDLLTISPLAGGSLSAIETSSISISLLEPARKKDKEAAAPKDGLFLSHVKQTLRPSRLARCLLTS